MVRFGWTELAYLLVVLLMLTAMLKVGPLIASAAIPGASATEGPLSQLAEESTTGDTPPENTTPEAAVTIPETSEELQKETPGPNSEHKERKESGGIESSGENHHEHAAVEGLYEEVDFENEAPVFYRPAESLERAVASRAVNPARSSNGEVCKNVSAAPPGARIVFPLTREHFDTYDDTWGAARSQGGHEGTDLMAEDGTPLLAMTDATVVPVAGANANGWNTLGGYTVMLRADYSIGPVRQGDLFYYAHMNRSTPLDIGDKVEVGEVVGYVGDTGQGPEGASGQFPPHLHLGWYDASGARSEAASGAMNPYPLLEWIKANGGSVKGGSNVPYCEAPQPDAPTPSGGGSWPTPVKPGVSPDLDTGTNSPAPSPVVPQNEPDAEGTGNNENNENRSENRRNEDKNENIPAATTGEAPEAVPGRGDKTADPNGAIPAPASSQDGTAGIAAGGSAQAGEAIGDAPASAPEAPDNVGKPLKSIWKLNRDERLQHLLKLQRRGVDFGERLERWLDRMLERDQEPAIQEPAIQAPAVQVPAESPSSDTCQTRPTDDCPENAPADEAADETSTTDSTETPEETPDPVEAQYKVHNEPDPASE